MMGKVKLYCKNASCRTEQTMLHKKMFALSLLIFLCNSSLGAFSIGEIQKCETSSTTNEYIKCNRSNIVKVVNIIQNGWIFLKARNGFIYIKKAAPAFEAMQCLDSPRFPDYIGMCNSSTGIKQKTMLKSNAENEGWIFTGAIGDTVYYRKQK